MHTEVHSDARLDGWEGPMFPDCVELMAELGGPKDFTAVWLNQVCQDIEGFQSHQMIETSDHYRWYWSGEFKCGGGEVIIAIPWEQDFSHRADPADRAPAVYAHGVSEEMADEVVRRVISAVHAARRPLV